MSAGRLLGGRYQVGELLGYGGMAEVHQGHDSRLGRDVAIKLLRVDLARDATFQMRFGREAQNAAALNHPAIVAVYDTGEEKGASGESLPYIVMEYVNGRTLKEVLTAEGPLMPRRALEISADICAALEFSHRHGIIHRDIKPGNVVLNLAGQVKVMDFGIARALASGASTMTQTSAVIGTAQYLSPEQARGEAVDARSDVYATGCVVFELLTGHPPFVGDNPVSVAYQHVREDPKPPSASNRDVTPDMDAIVLKALSKNPLNRYQSAAEMRADLLRAANGRPVLATPVMPAETALVETAPRIGPNGSRPTLPARVGNPQRRRASTWVMVALSVLGLVAVVALGTGLYLTSRTTVTKIPDVSNRSVSDATSLLKQHKLLVNPSPTAVQNSTCTPNTVVSTSPGQGETVDINSAVSLDVCTGPKASLIPPLVGQSETQAKAFLTGDGFTNVTYTPVDGLGPVGTVISVTPPSGTSLELTKAIVVDVSKGNQAMLPSLLGDTKAEANNTLKQLGFTNFKFATGTSDSKSDVGNVVNQTPAGKLLLTASIVINIGGPFHVTPTHPVTPPPSAGPSIGPPTPSPSASPSPAPGG
jgi:eukaryotic-like serine/threonine-protein kinase